MNPRSISLAGALLLGLACAPQELQPFLGAYSGSGEVTVTLFGSSVTQPRLEGLRVTQGSRTDLVLTTSRGCVLPANVEEAVAVLVPNTSCREAVTLPDGSSVAATLVVTEGSATRMGERLSLRYTGTLNVIYDESPHTADFSNEVTLTPASP